MQQQVGAASADASYVETDPIFLFFEETWIQPCTAQLPKPLHGLCMFAPALLAGILLVSLAACLAWSESRKKPKEGSAEAAKPAKATKTKKAKKVD